MTKRLDPDEMDLGEARRYLRRAIAYLADDAESEFFIDVDTNVHVEPQEEMVYNSDEISGWLRKHAPTLLNLALIDNYAQYKGKHNRWKKK